MVSKLFLSKENYVIIIRVKITIICGVPQGSILGPSLFLLCVDDLCNVFSKMLSLTFADDWNMLVSGMDPDDHIRTMNEEMVKVVDRLQIYRFSLNLKTHTFRSLSTEKSHAILICISYHQ